MNPAIPTSTHADRLAAAAEITAAARAQIDEAAALAAEVAALKLRAAGGDLDDQGAAELVAKAERLRVGDITAPRRQRALDDALAAEVRASLDVLADLARTVDGLEKEAAAAADALSGVLVDPVAQALRADTAAGYERDRGRCMVEAYMPGAFPASVLAERIRTAAAAEIVSTFDAEVAAIRSGINGLLAVHKAAAKAFG